MKSSFLVWVLLMSSPLHAAALTNKVLVIGIDGVMNSALAVANTPTLDALKSNGCYSVRVVSHPVTHSAAAWTSIFTGVWGDKHGVNDPGNSFDGNHLDLYPSFFSRLEEANPDWNTLAFARWAPITNAVPDADDKQAFGSDAAVTEATCQQLTNSNPDVFWMLLLDVDSAGHNYGWGPAVSQYVAAIETADGRVGQILNALTNRISYPSEDWLVIVQTDHGQHDNPDLEKSQIVWSIFSGLSVARGALWPAPSTVDVCPTLLTHMGVPINPAWKLDGHPAGFPLPPTRYWTNLLFNGNAEVNSGTNDYSPNRGVAWWFDTGSTTLGVYGANPTFPSFASPGPTNRGANFFLGGTTSGSILQRIDISDLAWDVDQSGVSYALSGWFGGVGAEEDGSLLSAEFLDGAGAAIGSNGVGRVTADERGGVTGLWWRGTNGLVPAGTRFIEFVLTQQGVTGMNDASADNLSFVLLPPALVITEYEKGPNTWSVSFPSSPNLHYVLERSETLVSWAEVTSPTVGTGQPLLLVDTNAPTGDAFYRVRRRQ